MAKIKTIASIRPLFILILQTITSSLDVNKSLLGDVCLAGRWSEHLTSNSQLAIFEECSRRIVEVCMLCDRA